MKAFGNGCTALGIWLAAGAGAAWAQDVAPAAAAVAEPAVSAEMFTTNNLWMMVATFLVFIMHLGFATVESGLTRAKNTVNILFKNTLIPAIGLLTYALIGFGLMYQGDWAIPGWLRLGGGVGTDAAGLTSAYNSGYTYWTDFLFQGMFAATAATIVSGAVAERIKFSAFLAFSVLLVAFVYPLSGHWIWGGGILGATPGESGLAAFFGNFRDFAGSTVVHSVGGWAALTGALILGPRLGKYRSDGKVNPIFGHSMTSAALGVLILWFGWFGFNPGSTMSVGNGAAIAHVLVNTNVAAATGAIGATIAAWLLLKKPDLSMVLNGCLAGLVAITAPCAFVTVGSGAAIGFIGGILVVLGVLFFDKVKIDDPVGALSVHLLNGVWGTLALGLFYDEGIATSVAALATGLKPFAQFLQQLKGAALVGAFTVVLSALFWYAIRALMGLRVSRAEEIGGLDVGEHGMEAYPDFQGFLTK